MPAPVVAVAAARTAGAGAARAGAGRAAGRKAAGKAGGRSLAGVTDAAVVTDELQRRRQAAAAKATEADEAGNLPAEAASSGVPAGGPDRKSSGRTLPAALTDQRGAPAVFRVDGLKAANAGGGFVLGMFAYVIGLTYLRDGKPGVQKWLKAKFFNEV